MIFDKTSIAFQINQFLSVQSDKSLKEAFQEEHSFQQNGQRFSLLEFIARDTLEGLIKSQKIDIPWNKKFHHSFKDFRFPDKLSGLEISMLVHPETVSQLISQGNINIKRNQIDDFVYEKLSDALLKKITPSENIFEKILEIRTNFYKKNNMKP